MYLKTIVLSFLVIFSYSCATTVKTSSKQLPKGVICDKTYHCEVEDVFDANIDVMKKCFKSQYPKVIKNYDGYSIIVRGIGIERSMVNSSLIFDTSMAVGKYFDILSDLYLEKFNEDIKVFLKEFTFYKEENFKDSKKIVKKVFTESNLTNLQTLGNLELENGRVISCKYFNLNSYIERRFVKIMPKSFKENLPSLLKETNKRFNKYMKQNFMSKEKPVDIGNMFVQKYHEPTKEEVDKTLERIKNEVPLIISFCGEVIIANEKVANCFSNEKTELSIVDLMELSYLPFLETMDLRGSKISNVSRLANFKTLKKLYLFPEQKDEDEVDVLRTVLPNIEVIVQGEKEIKRRDELKIEIENLQKEIDALVKKQKRTRNRRTKKTYQKSIDKLQDDIKKIQPELNKLQEFIAKEELRIKASKESPKENKKASLMNEFHSKNNAKTPEVLKKEIKEFQKSLEFLDIQKEEAEDVGDKDEIEVVDKKIKEVKIEISKLKLELSKVEK